MSLYAVKKIFHPISSGISLTYRTLIERKMRSYSCRRGNQYLSSRFNKPIVSIKGVFIPSNLSNKLQENYCLNKSQRFIHPCYKSYGPESQRITKAVYVRNWRWFAKSDDVNKGGPVKQTGGRIGNLDAVNEAGHFHKNNITRLEEVKKRLQAKALKELEKNPLKPIEK